MSRPRTSSARELYGYLGSSPECSAVLRAWNARFRAQGRDAVMSKYPATVATLPERLSEMFHFDRRGYVVSPTLRSAVMPLLDRLDPSAVQNGEVGYIQNDGGVLIGFADVPASMEFGNVN